MKLKFNSIRIIKCILPQMLCISDVFKVRYIYNDFILIYIKNQMITKITQDILASLPPSVNLRPEDYETLKASKSFVEERLDLITTTFYDVLFDFDKTKKVFKEGEREIREKSFKHWVRLTLTKEINQEYWEWQAYVGLIHVKRGIKNDIFIRMLNFVTEMLVAEVVNNVPPEQAVPILTAWLRLSAVVSALIAESYRLVYQTAVENVTGLSETLLDNVVKVEIDKLVSDNQKYRM